MTIQGASGNSDFDGGPSGPRASDLLAQSVTLVRAVRDRVSGGIVDFVVIDANATALQTAGSTYEDLVGTPLSELYADFVGSELYRTYASVVTSSEPYALNAMPYGDDGTGFYDLELRPHGDHLVIVWTDVSERISAINARKEKEAPAAAAAPARQVSDNEQAASVLAQRASERVAAAMSEAATARNELQAAKAEQDALRVELETAKTMAGVAQQALAAARAESEQAAQSAGNVSAEAEAALAAALAEQERIAAELDAVREAQARAEAAAESARIETAEAIARAEAAEAAAAEAAEAGEAQASEAVAEAQAELERISSILDDARSEAARAEQAAEAARTEEAAALSRKSQAEKLAATATEQARAVQAQAVAAAKAAKAEQQASEQKKAEALAEAERLATAAEEAARTTSLQPEGPAQSVSRLVAAGEDHVEHTMQRVAATVVTMFADGVLLSRRSPDGARMWPTVSDDCSDMGSAILGELCAGGPFDSTAPAISSALTDGRPLWRHFGPATAGTSRATGFEDWLPPELADAAVRMDACAVLVAPMRTPEGAAGILTVFRRRRNEGFSPDDETVLQDLADRAGLMLEIDRLVGDRDRLDYDLSRVRHALAPQPLPPLDGFEMAAQLVEPPTASGPASATYDVVPCEDGTTILSLLSVRGDGPAAGAIAGRLQAVGRRAALNNGDPARVVRELEETLADEADKVSCAVAIVSLPAEGTGIARVITAGAPPVLVHRDGEVLRVGRIQQALGSGSDATLEISTVELRDTDTFAISTDTSTATAFEGRIERQATDDTSDLIAGVVDDATSGSAPYRAAAVMIARCVSGATAGAGSRSWRARTERLPFPPEPPLSPLLGRQEAWLAEHDVDKTVRTRVKAILSDLLLVAFGAADSGTVELTLRLGHDRLVIEVVRPMGSDALDAGTAAPSLADEVAVVTEDDRVRVRTVLKLPTSLAAHAASRSSGESGFDAQAEAAAANR